MFFIGRTDGRSTQNYSSEPHKNTKKKCFLSGQTDGQTERQTDRQIDRRTHV